jgi:PadR family transcriptional regulator AphA
MEVVIFKGAGDNRRVSLRYALLALLTAQPMTGYDLAKSFHSSVGHVWHAPDSQIYPELRRMEQDALIEATEVTRASTANATKRVYRITDAGVGAFRAWMAVPTDYAPERDPAKLRSAYFEWTEPAAARAQLRAHLAHWTAMRAQWGEQLRTIGEGSHPIVAERLRRFPEAQWRAIVAYKVFTYEGLIAEADQQLDWARRGLALVDELAAGCGGV